MTPPAPRVAVPVTAAAASYPHRLSEIAIGEPPLQRKRSQEDVLAELSEHLDEKDRPVPKNAIVLPADFKTTDIGASEKAYDDSVTTGEKILAKIDNPPTREENLEYMRGVEATLNQHYHDITTAEVNDENIHPDAIKSGDKVDQYDIGTARQTGSGEVHYQNTYHPGRGEFVARANYGDKDKADASSKDPNHPEPMVTNADIIAAQIAKLHRVQNQRLEKDRDSITVKTIKRQGIVNPQTLNTIMWCDGSRMTFLFRQYGMSSTGVVERGDDDFAALLGSPNGRAAGWLYVRYAEHLGLNPIQNIRYSEKDMWIQFEAPANDPASDGEGEKSGEEDFM